MMSLKVVKVLTLSALGILFFYGTIISVCDYLAEVEMFRAYELLNAPSFPEAEWPTRQAVQHNPQNGYTHYYRAAFLKRAGRMEEARKELMQALRTTAHPASAYRLLAELELDEKRYGTAFDDYRRALLYDPVPHLAPALVWFDFGRAAKSAGFAGEALRAFRMSQRLPDPLPTSGPAIGFLLGWLGAADAGVQEYVLALWKYPELKEHLPTWAYNLATAGMNDFGVRLFSRFDALGWLDARGLCLLSSFYIYRREFSDAWDVLERAEKVNAQEPNVYLLMGEIHFQKGEKESMRRMYERFLRMMPDAPQRKSLEKRMRE